MPNMSKIPVAFQNALYKKEIFPEKKHAFPLLFNFCSWYNGFNDKYVRMILTIRAAFPSVQLLILRKERSK